MFSCSKQIGINQGSMNLNNPWGQCRLPEVFVSARGPTSLLSQARACCHLHGSGPSHQEILEASGMDRHPKGMWSQLGFACHPLCPGLQQGRAFFLEPSTLHPWRSCQEFLLCALHCSISPKAKPSLCSQAWEVPHRWCGLSSASPRPKGKARGSWAQTL